MFSHTHTCTHARIKATYQSSSPGRRVFSLAAKAFNSREFVSRRGRNHFPGFVTHYFEATHEDCLFDGLFLEVMKG